MTCNVANCMAQGSVGKFSVNVRTTFASTYKTATKIMENNDKLTAERSLEIIREAIEQGKRDVARNAGTPMIMWGVLTCVTGCIVCLLWQLTGDAVWNALWFAMCAVGWAVQTAMKHREHRESRPGSYVWKLVGWTWTVFGMLAVAVAVIGFLSYNTAVYASRLPITAVIMLLLMFASSVTAYVMRDKAYGVFIGANIILVNFVLLYHSPYEALCLALSAVTLLVIPGIMINRQAKRK